MENFYDILGVKKEDDLKIIKEAFRELVKKYHPDQYKNIDDRIDGKDKFIKITEAWETLSDPKKRAFYDKYGIQYVEIHEQAEMKIMTVIAQSLKKPFNIEKLKFELSDVASQTSELIKSYEKQIELLTKRLDKVILKKQSKKKPKKNIFNDVINDKIEATKLQIETEKMNFNVFKSMISILDEYEQVETDFEKIMREFEDDQE
jgi:curved DNA-binding protein CbpA